MVPETTIIGPQSLTTKDDVSVVVACVVTFQIDNVRKFLLEIEGAHQVIEDSAIGTVSHFITERTWEQLRKLDMGNELTKTVRREPSATASTSSTSRLATSGGADH